MVKKKLVKGTMLTALAALGMSLNLSSGEFEVTAYAADNPAVISAAGSSEETLRVMHDTYSREEEPGDDELSMEQYIASLATTADAGGWRIEDGVPYWYENGVKQGTEGRGKEIYDPGSNAWYWLDAVDGGRMAVSKDVYQESKADDEGNIGKWVRYDADGHMVKGWQTAETGTYFFDYTYGTMYKGDKVIDGVSYHFDETTGILDGGAPADDNGSSFAIDGWHTVGGTEYWYEGGIRQGVKYTADGSLDTSYRGKEIYDPGSNAWYWLDCVLGGAKAVSKDVYQESKADDEGNIGKWVRYDADGHMVKGWQTAEAGTYFFDYTYGTMAKGKVVMDGFKYTFDEATGILLSKEAHVHSSIFSYSYDENGKYYTYTYCNGDLSTGEWNYYGACGSAPVWDGRSFVPQADTAILSKQTYPSWYDEHPDIQLNVATGNQIEGTLEMYFSDGDWTGVSEGCGHFGYSNPNEYVGTYSEGVVYHGWLSKD